MEESRTGRATKENEKVSSAALTVTGVVSAIESNNFNTPVKVLPRGEGVATRKGDDQSLAAIGSSSSNNNNDSPPETGSLQRKRLESSGYCHGGATGSVVAAAAAAAACSDDGGGNCFSPPADLKSAAAAAVACDTPNIPNVVEYHLKVKPPPTPAYSRQQQVAGKQRRDCARRDGSAVVTDTTSTAALVATGVGRDMKKEQSPHQTLTEEQRKELTLRLSKLSVDSNVFEGSSDLPQVFQVKYLGSHDARGLWGIKHTRKPVDNMVAAAKSLPSGTILPFIKLVISEDGVGLLPLGKRRGDSITRIYPIESISYGVQDLVYTRVFSMIVVRETDDFRRVSPFECHGFVCESKHHARQMTYALAAAFQIYSQHVKDKTVDPAKNWSKGFAIELKNPNEIEADYTINCED